MAPPFPTFLRWQLSPNTLGSLVPVSVTMSPCLPLSLCMHLSLYILVSSCDTFHVCKNTNIFYLMNRDMILEPILLLSGIHWEDWRMYLTSPFPYCECLCFHLWESQWVWGPWSLWGIICISSLSKSSAGSWCSWSCPGVLWYWNHWRVPKLGGNTNEKQLREMKLSTKVFHLVAGTTY